jgi:uncharacterized DUF497 family protein/predicted DNA binding CopG/RHH family protein
MVFVKLPDYISFDWDKGNQQKNWNKHKITAEEAEEPFFTDDYIILEDESHSSDHENRYILIGTNEQKNILFIVFTLRAEKYGLFLRETQTKRRCYFMKKRLNLPKFKNEDEERDFWDKIDITEYFEPKDVKRIIFPNLKRTNKPISIRLPEPLIQEAKNKAQKLRVPYQKLMREVLQHGIRAIKT